MRKLLIIFLFSLKIFGTNAQVSVLKDFSSAVTTPAIIDNLTSVNSNLYYTVDYRLWKSDGTDNGTSIVKASDGQTVFSTNAMAKFKNNLVFISYTGQLYITDGTGLGTILLRNFYSPSYGGSNPFSFIEMGNYLYFSVPNQNSSDYELWRTDGTSMGTTLVKDINTGLSGSYPKNFQILNPTTFIFSAFSSSNGTEIWKSDGTTNGTILLHDVFSGVSSSEPTKLTKVGADIFFVAQSTTGNLQLWRTDGTTLYSFRAIYDNYGSDITGMTVNNSDLYFKAGCCIWKANSQGLEATSASGAYYFSQLSNLNNNLILSSSRYPEIWKFNLSDNSTSLVKNYFVIPQCYYSNASQFTKLGSKIFFTAATGSLGEELWSTDGTESGTQLVKDINSLSGCYKSSNPKFLTDVNGTLFFTADDGIHGTQLWKSDGTSNGTVMLKYVYYSASSSITKLVKFKGKAYFGVKKSGEQNFQIWKTDGSEQGTKLVDSTLLIENPLIVALKNKLIIIDNKPTVYNNVWAYDEQIGKTVIGSSLDEAENFVDYKGYIYFSAFNSAFYKLYRTDGTLNGTVAIKILHFKYINTTTYPPPSISIINDTLYVKGGDGFNHYTDGISPVVSYITIPNDPTIEKLGSVFLNGKYYKAIDQSPAGGELYSSIDFVNWTLVKDITPGPSGTSINELTILNNKIYFYTYLHLPNTTALWESDGTENGTKIVKIVNPNSFKYYSSFKKLGNKLYFITDDGTHGSELWTSDGTTNGTNLVIDLNQSPYDSDIGSPCWVGKNILFSGFDNGVFGREVWKIPINCSPDYVDSAQSGSWQNSSTWSCGINPTVTDNIIINQGHVVNLNQQVTANNLTLKGILNYLQGGKIKLGNQ